MVPAGRVLWVFLAAALVVCGIAGYVFWAMGNPGFWEGSIRKFEEADRVQPPNPGCIVFTGSSSINFWKSLPADMAPLDVINRGFGGSHIAHVNVYASRIILPYRPRAVLLYAGENDLSFPASKSPQTVLDDFKEFVQIIHANLPNTWIYYISMKPTPLRWKTWPEIRQTNKMIEEFCRTQNRVQYIDVSVAMLDADGKPRRDIYRADRLHMNAQGYAIWISIIKPILMSRFGPPAADHLAPVNLSMALGIRCRPDRSNAINRFISPHLPSVDFG